MPAVCGAAGGLSGGDPSGADLEGQGGGGGAKRGGGFFGFFGEGGFHGGGPFGPAAFPARGPRGVPGRPITHSGRRLLQR